MLSPSNVSGWLYEQFEEITCSDISILNSSAARCEFVRSNYSDCEYDGVFYSYTELTYCSFGEQRAVAILVLVLILLGLFLCMGIIADDFLCPSLLTVSKTFRLPDHIAGVTFLAFGNGAPDIFSSIGGISQAKPQLIFSSLYGGGIFVTTLVTGSVLITGNFTLMKRPILRDIIFYVGAAFIAWFFVHSEHITIGKSITLIVYYIAYIVAVVLGRYIYVKLNPSPPKRTASDEIAVIQDPESSPGSFNSEKKDSLNSTRSRTLSYDSDIVLTRYHQNGTFRARNRARSEARHPVHHHFENTILHITNIYETQKTKDINANDVVSSKPVPPLLKQSSVMSILSRESVMEVFDETRDFLIHILPIDSEEWPEMAIHSKILAIVKAIPYFLMTISIPVVDLESENENWCRLLICVNLFIAPQVVLFFLKISGAVFSVPVWAICLIVSSIASIAVILTSEKTKPPVYHRVFAILGFTVSVILINSVADEVISVLQTAGIIFELSDSILGLTVLAWGNSLGDLIADMSLARAGYPAMAIGACFGGPMLNLLMGLGIPYTIMFVKGEVTEVGLEYNNMMTLLYVTLTASLMLSLIYLVVNRFRSAKLHGILLIILYVIYTIIAFLIEYKVIPNN